MKAWKKNVKIHPVLVGRFSQNVKTLRVKRGWTHEVMAPLVGITGAYLSMLECGKRTPSLEIVERIAKAFKVDPSVLLKEVRS